jgi:AcrR family transcriptional regulator
MTTRVPSSPANATADDRRRMRTRAALREALLMLILERGWDAIAVQDLCERANIGRSTFYTHYPNKDALLVGSLDELRAALRQSAVSAREGGASSDFGFALGLIEHAYEQRRLFKSLVGRRSGYAVQQRFKEMVIKLVGDELPAGSAAGLPRAAAQRWIAGAFVELLGWWIEQRSLLPPTELAAMFETLARPVWLALLEPQR